MRRAALLLLLPLCGCMVGPDYRRPAAPGSPVFKEQAGWLPATPIDAIDKGAWWSVYNDPLLDRLEREIDVSNQTLAASLAAYRLSEAIVQEARANLFPVLSANASDSRSSSGGGGGRGVTTNTLASPTLSGGGSTVPTATGTTSGGVASSTGLTSTSLGSRSSTRTTYSVEGQASWNLDVWGRIRRTVESDVAGAQASAADVANARLSAQGALAVDYFDLRASDALYHLLDATVRDYRRSLSITQNQYQVGVAARSDVITAQVQLETAQAQLVNTGVARATFEHAIAVFTGHPPAELTIARGDLASDVPVVPAGVPSSLLQRRPDIAAAERVLQQENALIGAAIANYYPDISLSALYGFSGDPISSLISASNRLWSLAASASETVFEGGARSAAVSAARATYDEQVANYRQTVLIAFEQVEDELSSLRILQDEARIEDAAVVDARRAVQIAINEYRAGTQPYTTVVTAENTALGDEQAALTIRQNRLVASVTLIQALGGGWDATRLPGRDSLQRGIPFLPDALDPTLPAPDAVRTGPAAAPGRTRPVPR